MSKPIGTDSQRRLVAGALTGTAIGIGILKAAGVDMPVVPPSLVLLLVAAVVVVMVRRRWALILGVVIGAAELFGVFVGGSASDLIGFTSLPIFVGNWIRLLGSITAIVVGVQALRGRSGSASSQQPVSSSTAR